MFSLLPFFVDQWRKTVDSWPESDATFERLISKINGNNLPYHNLEHIAECLEALDWTVRFADNPRLVRVAIWYHDETYDPKRKDNEELSAENAVAELSKLKILGKPIDTKAVKQLILATKHAVLPTSNDAKLLVDIDLRILGTDYIRYRRYSLAIAEEFKHVEASAYRIGRSKVLQSFLDREYIYSTDFFREHYEASARKNLADEIRLLTS